MTDYILIRNSEGDTYVTKLTEAELLERIEEQYWGSAVKFLSNVPKDADTNMWPEDAILIIACNIIVPQPVEIITKYKLK